MKLGIDVKTGMTILAEHHTPDGVSKTEVTELKKFNDGIYFPIEVVSYNPDGKISSRTQYSDIEFNKGIADERFTFIPPADAITFDESILKEADRIIPEYEEKVKAAPEDAALRYALIQLYQRSSLGYSTLPHLEKLIQLKPNMVGAYSQFGSVLFNLERHKEAVAIYQKLINLRPDMATAHLQLGQTYLQIDRAEKALKHLQKALELALRI